MVVSEDTGQIAPSIRRIAQAKLLGDLTRETSPFQVVHRLGTGFEVLAVRLAGFFKHFVQSGLALALLLCALTLGGVGIVLGNLQAITLRQIFHCLDETHAAMLHQKANGVAVLAAAKAMEKLFGGADRKRGRFFPMKRAQAHVIGAALFQRHIAAHHLHHIGAVDQLLDEGLGDGHFSRQRPRPRGAGLQRQTNRDLSVAALASRWACPSLSPYGQEFANSTQWQRETSPIPAARVR